MNRPTTATNTFGERLSLLIEDKGITVYRVSADTKITQTTISNYLKDKTKPDPNKLDVLCNYFRVSSDWLLTGKGEMKGESSVAERSSKYGTSGNYDHEEAIRMHKLLKEYIPESMMDVWEKQLQELVDLCEYKELYIKAKEYYVGKKK